MPACALVAQKNFVLHHSRPDERPAFAGMTVRGARMAVKGAGNDGGEILE